jgi:hypothetical protein
METRMTPHDMATRPKPTEPQKESLKGTFSAVLLIGAFILLSWFGAFALFLDRA